VSGIRYANIGAAVGIAIIGIGVLLFKNSSDALIQVVGLVGFVVGGAVYVVLDERATRREENRPQ
jgi:threonine/homoserine efflux transporter RhtA